MAAAHNAKLGVMVTWSPTHRNKSTSSRSTSSHRSGVGFDIVDRFSDEYARSLIGLMAVTHAYVI
jgi:hypothetical protein